MKDHAEPSASIDTMTFLDQVADQFETIYSALGIEKDGALAQRIAADADLGRLLAHVSARLAGPLAQATVIRRSRVRPDLKALRDQLLGIVDADEPTETA